MCFSFFGAWNRAFSVFRFFTRFLCWARWDVVLVVYAVSIYWRYSAFATKHSVGLARSKALFQVIFNILLISPLGFLGSIVFRWNFLKILIFSFFIALFFELTQGTGVFGFFECPYRLFDVDDLMLNASGAVLGFLVTLPLRKETKKFLRQEKFIIQKNILIL